MISQADSEYMKLVECFDPLVADIQNMRKDRTGVGTYSIFSPATLKVDIIDTFPLLSVKKINFAHIVHEVIWYFSGSTNVKYLEDHNINIWSDWKDENGDLGPVYGKQWRNFEGPDGSTDQVQRAINTLKKDPFSRRNLVIGFNPSDQPKKAPQGCHTLVQFYVSPKMELSLQVYQRSGDLMLGVPYNIAMYGLILEIFAKEAGLTPRNVHFCYGDLHIYANHLDGLAKLKEQHVQLKKDGILSKPYLKLNDWNDVNSLKLENFELCNYKPLNFIKFPIAV